MEMHSSKEQTDGTAAGFVVACASILTIYIYIMAPPSSFS